MTLRDPVRHLSFKTIRCREYPEPEGDPGETYEVLDLDGTLTAMDDDCRGAPVVHVERTMILVGDGNRCLYRGSIAGLAERLVTLEKYEAAMKLAAVALVAKEDG